jgi:hypothetical protein
MPSTDIVIIVLGTAGIRRVRNPDDASALPHSYLHPAGRR